MGTFYKVIVSIDGYHQYYRWLKNHFKGNRAYPAPRDLVDNNDIKGILEYGRKTYGGNYILCIDHRFYDKSDADELTSFTTMDLNVSDPIYGLLYYDGAQTYVEVPKILQQTLGDFASQIVKSFTKNVPFNYDLSEVYVFNEFQTNRIYITWDVSLPKSKFDLDNGIRFLDLIEDHPTFLSKGQALSLINKYSLFPSATLMGLIATDNSSSDWRSLSKGRNGFYLGDPTFTEGSSEFEFYSKACNYTGILNRPVNFAFLPGVKDTCDVYHSTRSKDLDEIFIKNRFKKGSGGGTVFGAGFYANFYENHALKNHYGIFTLKARVRGLSKCVILSTAIAELLTGKKWTVPELFAAQGLDLSKYNYRGSDLSLHQALKDRTYFYKLQHHYQGMIYHANFDGQSVVMWNIDNVRPLGVRTNSTDYTALSDIEKVYEEQTAALGRDVKFSSDVENASSDEALYKKIIRALARDKLYVSYHQRLNFYKKMYPQLKDRLDQIEDSAKR